MLFNILIMWQWYTEAGNAKYNVWNKLSYKGKLIFLVFNGWILFIREQLSSRCYLVKRYFVNSVDRSQIKTKPPDVSLGVLFLSGGEGGIRTLDTFSRIHT
ncbi:hypothetical protein, partial [Dickeya dianthicola]|uniref:hypothetical protein n=1 Tax=Dickeya dianthicola TaxID=204039 RepID=UPI001E4BE7E3